MSLDKLEGVDYKCYNGFSIFQSEDPNRAFLVPRIFFLFWMKLYVFTNSREPIKNVVVVFIVQKYLNKVFLDPSLKVSCFWMKLCMLSNSSMLITNTKLDFWISSPKYPIKTILVPNLRIFIFVFEGADVKYHSTVAFLSSSPQIPKQDNFFVFNDSQITEG